MDCEIFDNMENRLKIIKLIRECKPRLILAPMWKGEQNHPDHIATGLLARYAARYARFAKLLPELPIHHVEGVLHYLQGNFDPDFIIDVSEHLEGWKKMMACHDSQMQTNNYTDWVLRGATELGVRIKKKYAQGLIKGNPIVIDDLMSISRGTYQV